jgi:hypothetical protein
MRARRMGEGRRRADAGGRRAATFSSRPTSCCWRWASSGRASRAARPVGRRARPARQRPGRHETTRPATADKRLRLRRHAARPVAGGLGDPRGPPMRARRRRDADGTNCGTFCAFLRAWLPHRMNTLGSSRAATAATAASVIASQPRPAWLPARPASTVSELLSSSTPCRAQCSRLPCGAGRRRGRFQLLVDVHQRRRHAHPFGHREAQPVRLPRPVIGVLPEDHHLDRLERGQLERAQPLAARRIDRLARVFLGAQPAAQPARFPAGQRRIEHRAPAFGDRHRSW